MLVVRVLVFILGFGIVIATVLSATRTFVLPRSAVVKLTRAVFLDLAISLQPLDPSDDDL